MLELHRVTNWRIDRTRSTVGFRIRHFGIATVRGEFTSFAAELQRGDGLTVEGHVDVASVETGDEVRDQRLREEFFDAARFPAITLRATGDGRLVGELTIRDVTRPVVLSLDMEQLDAETLHACARGTLRRSDFGLDWDALKQAGRLLVADEVRIVADVHMIRH